MKGFPIPVFAVLALILILVHGLAGPLIYDAGTNVVMVCSNLFCLFMATVAWHRRGIRGTLLLAGVWIFLFLLIHVVAAEPLLFAVFSVLAAGTSMIQPFLGYTLIMAVSVVSLTHYWLIISVVGCLLYTVAFQLMKLKGRLFHSLSLATGVALLGVTLFPILYLGFQTSPQSLAVTFQNQEFRDAMKVSLYTSTVSTLLITVFGVPLAYGLARLKFSGKKFIDAVIDLPILIPHSVAGVAIFGAFGPKSPVGVWLMQTLGLRFSGTEQGIILAQIFVAYPFLVRSAMNAFETMGEEFENVARTLGASPWRAFWKVAFPMALPAVFDGMILSWARAISEFGSILVIAPEPKTMSIHTFDQFLRFGINEARPPAVLLIMICLWLFICMRWGRGVFFGRGGRES
ncbi:MAG: hypothetical protein CVV64_01430 [Candidatus Wallbacteria bacterium HGW-Wallbacteria-1]|jgi:molybdate/tungstate transport system permease protein|uniref:ABC transmembrane type-1 domain-containing protein n=1 Tax=Candidatus Wallbacteria bacterium HGW-Wallbacteria-1 TaxID=2013854 RepID=A0A2N1PUW2_9BACT|nr:MAG: hypothetical protein CVV64_01430 [Candidatus Wallbacteria bacterium HGW-Wallbacteria-1]